MYNYQKHYTNLVQKKFNGIKPQIHVTFSDVDFYCPFLRGFNFNFACLVRKLRILNYTQTEKYLEVIIVGFRVKRQHKDHLYQVAIDSGISERTADRIVSAYLDDLKESLKAGESITVPGLFTITVSKFTNGDIEMRGSVSTSIKKEVRGY